MTQKAAVKAGLVRPDWEGQEEVRLKAMLWVLELKLHFNPSTFGETLRATEGRQIVEVSRKDDYWGCKPAGDGLLVGQNHLGKLLCDVRSRMSDILRGKFTYPKGFLLGLPSNHPRSF